MRHVRELAHAALLLLAAALAAWLSVQWPVSVDLSAGARASLGASTRALLARLEGPVEVVSYAREDGGLREGIARFVARYQALKPDIALRFVNPDLDPGAMRELGISVDGEIVLNFGGRTQRLTTLDERAFSTALLRLERGRERVLAYVDGHGERRPDGEANHDHGRFASALAGDGVRAVRLNLIEQGTVPANVDALVIAGPRAAWQPAEARAVIDWIDGGGALLWLAEPGGVVPEGLEAALGVRLLPGTAVDATGQGLGLGDPSFVALTRHPPHPALAGYTLTTLLPQAVALAHGGAAFAAAPLLTTSERSWTESGPIADAIAYQGENGELPGPLDLALALTRLSPRPDAGEQRVLVLGDGDLWSNQYLGNGGNLDLGKRLINWLLADDALIDLPLAEAPDRALSLPSWATMTLGLVFLLLPLPLLLAGALIRWRRRRA